jgi:hypothetical protein
MFVLVDAQVHERFWENRNCTQSVIMHKDIIWKSATWLRDWNL